MRANASSAQTRVDVTLPAVSVTLALGMSACFTYAIGSFLSGRMGSDLNIGWVLGLLSAAVATTCATRAEWWRFRLSIAIAFIFLAPLGLFLFGNSAIGLGWLALGSGSYCLAVPAVEWACSTTVSHSIGSAQSLQMALAGSAKNRDPFVGASFAGILAFALPGDRWLMAGLATGYFGCLFMLVSFGRMVRRANEAESERVLIDQRFLRRWFLACLALLLILALSGGVASQASRWMKKPNEMPPGGAGATAGQVGVPRGEADTPKPPTEEKRIENPKSQNNGKPQPAKPKPKPPEPPKKPDENRLLIFAAILAAIAAALLWIAKKYGERIVTFFRRKFVEPVAARIRDWRELARIRRREAAIEKTLSTMADPFRELPEATAAHASDLPNLFGAVVADAYLVGTEMADSETMGVFLGRLNRVHALPKSEIETVRRVCARAEFASVPPSQEEVSRAFTAGHIIRTTLRKHISEEALPKKQAAYKRRLAEAKLDAKTPEIE